MQKWEKMNNTESVCFFTMNIFMGIGWKMNDAVENFYTTFCHFIKPNNIA